MSTMIHSGAHIVHAFTGIPIYTYRDTLGNVISGATNASEVVLASNGIISLHKEATVQLKWILLDKTNVTTVDIQFRINTVGNPNTSTPEDGIIHKLSSVAAVTVDAVNDLGKFVIPEGYYLSVMVDRTTTAGQVLNLLVFANGYQVSSNHPLA